MEKLIHIVPLGWEHDRAVKPLEAMRVHKVYALVWVKEPRREQYLARFLAWAKKRGIEFEVVDIDTFHSLPSVMRAVSKIIIAELAAGNRIYINVSTSGKVAAIGATLAAMAHLPPSRGTLYFVVALDYPAGKKALGAHGVARGMWGEPQPIPIFPLALPDPDCRLVLTELATATRPLAYAHLIGKLGEAGVPPFREPLEERLDRAARTKIQVAFHRRIVTKLLALELISVEKSGRQRRLALTPAGQQFAALCVAA